MKRWLLLLSLLACRSVPPAQRKPSLTVRVLERTIIGLHYEALLRLRALPRNYAYTFTCTPHLVYRNDCPCPESRGVLPDSVILPWMERVLHLPDTLEPWVDASLSRVVIQAHPPRVIRYPTNLLRELFPVLCPAQDSGKTDR